jgi:hypothetical protein
MDCYSAMARMDIKATNIDLAFAKKQKKVSPFRQQEGDNEQ